MEEGFHDGYCDGRITASVLRVTAEVGADFTVVVLDCLIEGGMQAAASL